MREPHEPIDEPLEQLSDLALAWLGDLTLRGDTPLRRKSPRLIDWLGCEACREQARRRGEAVEPAPALGLGAWTTPELLGAGEAAAWMTIACRQMGDPGTIDRLTGEQRERVRPDLADEHEEPALESMVLWATITEAVRRQLALTAALEAQTTH